MKTKKAKYIFLPLKVPVEIQTWITRYAEWERNKTNYPYSKKKICEGIAKACKRWHMINHVEMSAGTIMLVTEVGVDIISDQRHRDPPYVQLTNGLREMYQDYPPAREKIGPNGKPYRYVYPAEKHGGSKET